MHGVPVTTLCDGSLTQARALTAPGKVLRLLVANLRKISGEKWRASAKIDKSRSMKNNFYFWVTW